LVLFFKYEILDLADEAAKKLMADHLCKFFQRWDDETCLFFLKKAFDIEPSSSAEKQAELADGYKLFEDFEKEHMSQYVV